MQGSNSIMYRKALYRIENTSVIKTILLSPSRREDQIGQVSALDHPAVLLCSQESNLALSHSSGLLAVHLDGNFLLSDSDETCIYHQLTAIKRCSSDASFASLWWVNLPRLFLTLFPFFLQGFFFFFFFFFFFYQVAEKGSLLPFFLQSWHLMKSTSDALASFQEPRSGAVCQECVSVSIPGSQPVCLPTRPAGNSHDWSVCTMSSWGRPDIDLSLPSPHPPPQQLESNSKALSNNG